MSDTAIPEGAVSGNAPAPAVTPTAPRRPRVWPAVDHRGAHVGGAARRAAARRRSVRVSERLREVHDDDGRRRPRDAAVPRLVALLQPAALERSAALAGRRGPCGRHRLPDRRRDRRLLADVYRRAVASRGGGWLAAGGALSVVARATGGAAGRRRARASATAPHPLGRPVGRVQGDDELALGPDGRGRVRGPPRGPPCGRSGAGRQRVARRPAAWRLAGVPGPPARQPRARHPRRDGLAVAAAARSMAQEGRARLGLLRRRRQSALHAGAARRQGNRHVLGCGHRQRDLGARRHGALHGARRGTGAAGDADLPRRPNLHARRRRHARIASMPPPGR